MVRITAPHFVAAVVFERDVVVRAAPVLRYMLGWTRFRVESYCVRKQWRYQRL